MAKAIDTKLILIETDMVNGYQTITQLKCHLYAESKKKLAY